MKSFGTWVPRQLWIGITNRCLCNCVHCLVGPSLNKNGKTEFTTAEYRRLIDEGCSLGFMEAVYFGGEPLLRNDIVELVDYANTKGLLASLFTNGVMLSKEMADRLKGAGLNMCNVSLDSANPATHDRLRGLNGCFNKAVKGIRYIVANEIKCSIWTYASKEDIRNGLIDLRNLILLGKELRVDKINILFPMASGNWLCSWSEMLTAEERGNVRALHAPPFVNFEFPDEGDHCSAGKVFIYISPEGDVYPCPALSHCVLGNIRSQQLNSILRNLINNNAAGSQSTCSGECWINKRNSDDRKFWSKSI